VRRELDISFRDRYPFNDDFVTKNTIPRSIKKTSNSRVLIEASLIRKSLDHKEILKGGYNMRANKPKTKILIDGGDPDETLRIKKLIGFVDGQTTNPSLIAKKSRGATIARSGTSAHDRGAKRRVQEDRTKDFSTRRGCGRFNRSLC